MTSSGPVRSVSSLSRSVIRTQAWHQVFEQVEKKVTSSKGAKIKIEADGSYYEEQESGASK